MTAGDRESKLLASMREGRAMHGYLITCADESKAFDLCARCAAVLLFGTEETERLPLSPDYFLLDGTVRIEDVRQIRRELGKTTFSSVNRAVVVRNAHKLNGSSVNAMLKMLEEPPEGTHFFLTGVEYRIIPTIRSRCMIVRLGQVGTDEIVRELELSGCTTKEANEYARMSGGSVDLALRLYRDEAVRELRTDAVTAMTRLLKGSYPFNFSKKIGKDREKGLTALTFMLGVCHDALSILTGTADDGGFINTDIRPNIEAAVSKLDHNKLCGAVFALTDAAERLNSNANAAQLIDRLILDVHGIVKNTGKDPS